MRISLLTNTVEEALETIREYSGQLDGLQAHAAQQIKDAAEKIQSEIDRGKEIRKAEDEIEQMLATVESPGDYEDVLDRIDEMEDRFGMLPVIAGLRSKAHTLKTIAEEAEIGFRIRFVANTLHYHTPTWHVQAPSKEEIVSRIKSEFGDPYDYEQREAENGEIRLTLLTNPKEGSGEMIGTFGIVRSDPITPISDVLDNAHSAVTQLS